MKKMLTILAILLLVLAAACNGDTPVVDGGQENTTVTDPDGSGSGTGSGPATDATGHVLGADVIIPTPTEELSKELLGKAVSVILNYADNTEEKQNKAGYFPAGDVPYTSFDYIKYSVHVGSDLLYSFTVENGARVYTFGPVATGTSYLKEGAKWIVSETSSILNGEQADASLATTLKNELAKLDALLDETVNDTYEYTINYKLKDGSDLTAVVTELYRYIEETDTEISKYTLMLSKAQQGIKEVTLFSEFCKKSNFVVVVDGTTYFCSEVEGDELEASFWKP